MTELDKIVDCIKNEHVYIQTHNFPDPDAVASAYGLQYLFAKRGVKSDIIYKGNIDRTAAQRMAEMLNITITEFSTVDLKDEDELILVDAQKGNSNIIDMVGDEIVCIDHHPIFEKENYRFDDIRPEIGACASIIAGYFYDNGYEIPQNIATALMYGIKMDTADMRRGVSQLDLDMYYRMYLMADRDILYELDNSVLQVEDLSVYRIALNNYTIYNNMCFIDVGFNCKESLLATICDFVMKLDGINFVVGYSIKEDGVKLSIRSNGKFAAGRIANAALAGIGSGGGHDNMAGGFIPHQDMDEEDLKKEIVDRFRRFVS